MRKQIWIKWTDSHLESGWVDLTNYHNGECIIETFGVVVYEDDKIICVAGSYSKGNEYAAEQANGIMTIPKVSILEMNELYSN